MFVRNVVEKAVLLTIIITLQITITNTTTMKGSIRVVKDVMERDVIIQYRYRILENKIMTNKEFNLAILSRLAKFYDVSLEWLAETTEVREGSQTNIDELMLDDETIDLLKSGRFNNRILCEIVKHPDFVKLMTEIYVDGIATMQIKNMNDWLDAFRLQIIQQKNLDVNALYLKVLEAVCHNQTGCGNVWSES